MNKDNFFNKFKSPMPKHLTPEERERWEEDYAWELQERERRRKEGYYDEKPKKKKSGWKLIQKLFGKN